MRRILTMGGLLMALGAAAPAASADPFTCPPAKTGTALVDAIGMNTHFKQGWQYEDYRRVIAMLKDLGVRQLREGFAGPGQIQLETAVRAGMKFNFVIEPKFDRVLIEKLEFWEKRFPGSILSIEGPNEVNNWPVKIDGLDGIPAAKRFQQTIYDGVKASPVLKHIPVLALTSYPVFANPADIGNIHVYSRSGGGVIDEIDGGLKDEREHNPDRRSFWITESGYETLVGPGEYEGVSEDVQAKLLLDLLLNASVRGIDKVFLYQFLDQYTDPKDVQAHFGIVRLDWQPKPAFAAIRNLIKIFSAGAAPAPATGLSYRLEGLPGTGAQAVYQLGDRSWIVAVWDNRRIWDNTDHRPVAAFETPVTLVLPRKDATVSVFDPVAGPDPQSVSTGVDRVAFKLAAAPLFLRVDAAGVGCKN